MRQPSSFESCTAGEQRCPLDGHRKFDIDQLIGRLISRCNALDLCAEGSDAESLTDLTAFVTAIASNTLTVREEGR